MYYTQQLLRYKIRLFNCGYKFLFSEKKNVTEKATSVECVNVVWLILNFEPFLYEQKTLLCIFSFHRNNDYVMCFS